MNLNNRMVVLCISTKTRASMFLRVEEWITRPLHELPWFTIGTGSQELLGLVVTDDDLARGIPPESAAELIRHISQMARRD